MNRMFRPGWPGNLLALAAGALTTLALAPFDIWPLAILSMALHYLGLRELTSKQAALRGWFYGFGLYAAGTSWIYVSIQTFGGAPPVLAALLILAFVAAVALFFSLPAWVWARWIRRSGSPLTDAAAFAALWIAQDAFRGWFLTGFPWLYQGYSQLEGPLGGFAPLGGIWLIGFILALDAALLANLPRLRVRRQGLAIALVLLAAPWSIAPMLKNHAWTTSKGEPLRVVAIQGNIEQELKWDQDQRNRQLQLYRDLTFASRPADLIIWPETAIPMLKDRAEAEGYLPMMGHFASGRDAALITGVPIRQPNERGEMRYYNGLTVVGKGQGEYRKQKLVPFGEYVPLQDLLRGLIAFFNLPMSDFARGEADQPLPEAKGYRIAPYICYEVVYPEFVATMAARSDLLLTISNDAWFGHSIGPLQHLQMARMRALEAGRWMIRATNNGVTALIDPFGRITEQVPAFQRAVLYGDVEPMQGLTPYLRWKSWPLALLCTVLLGWAIVRRKKEQAARV
ncbi:apolipoprotein N-acyltransferase [Azomonas macrocytogenes]|uniref:Apolipoprotein N-acyltransferase n=1 Tax=Azomonas macrocytogenes TaxID=69962 RepID=A0A839T1P5_AZOMA|nr:apolipoprotein N-acyltransferase [Azomonas macrocytogenes]MBB3102530.1 apolipoprotein N-acyltransferase [Azomonas macrocytogenes]